MMTKDDLHAGMEVFGFKFKTIAGQVGYVADMNKHINKPGILDSIGYKTCKITFGKKDGYYYPIDLLLKDLDNRLNPPIDLDDLFDQIKQL